MRTFAKKPNQAAARAPGQASYSSPRKEAARHGFEEFAVEPAHGTKPRLGHDFGRIRAHAGPQSAARTGLAVGAANDRYEQEADHIAEQVLRMPEPRLSAAGPVAIAGAAGGVQRKCAACEEEDEKLARKEASADTAFDGTEAPPIVHEALRSPGTPLSAETRSFFEPRFGTSLASIRIHAHELAGRSAQAVNALAYTVGNHIVFGNGQYSPGTWAGNRLIAHELAHTMQQTGRSLASPVPVSRGPLAVSRATVRVGNARAEVNYGDLIHIAPSDYLATIQSRYRSYTGSPLPAPLLTQITAFSPPKQEWVLYAIDVLSENTTRAPGLNRPQAFQRVVDRAPSSATRALGTVSQQFEREVLVVSGWAEEAISGRLPAPGTSQLNNIDPLLNPPADASAPPGGVFDTATFNTELPILTRDALTHAGQNPANWPGTRAQPLADVQAVGNVIQAQALSFFAPFAGTARDNRWLAGWQYGSHISSATTDPSGAPRTIPQAERKSLLANRAEIAGRRENGGHPSLFSRTNYDENRHADAVAFDQVVSDLEADPAVQALTNELLRHTGHHVTATHEVRISTEVSTATSECDTRWNTIRTLCHELMHAMAHPDFTAAASSSPRFPNGVRFDQVLIEGFAEVLGVQLFRHIRGEAAHDAGLRGQLTQGVTGNCAPPTTPVSIGYGAAGENAALILGEVGDSRYRAAFFHGRTSLIGL